MTEHVEAVPSLDTTLAIEEVDFSLWSLLWDADIVVQGVLLVLLLASIAEWAVIFNKWSQIRILVRRSRKFERFFWSGATMDALYEGLRQRESCGLSLVFAASMEEWQRSTVAKSWDRAALDRRLQRVMAISLARSRSELQRAMSYLATVGSAAPFIGLFGTVWGIMNAFSAIAGQQNTSLVVVAPGIAEALFATACGLIAAIPAVIAYNRLAAMQALYLLRAQSFSGELANILSRELDGLTQQHRLEA